MPNPPKERRQSRASKWWRLPFALRGDRDFLPDEDEDGIAQLKLDEERRLMYVGVTRAKRRLVLSRRLVLLGQQGAQAAVGLLGGGARHRARDGCATSCECPDENPHPESGSRRRGRASRDATRAATRRRSRASSPSSSACGRSRQRRPRAAPWRRPTTLSVTALLTFVRDEDEFFWRYVRRVPSPPSPAAQLGIERAPPHRGARARRRPGRRRATRRSATTSTRASAAATPSGVVSRSSCGRTSWRAASRR